MSKISNYMSSTIYSTSPDTLAYLAINEMYKNKVGALLVKVMAPIQGCLQKWIGWF